MEIQAEKYSYVVEMISELFQIPVAVWEKENLLQSFNCQMPFPNLEMNQQFLSAMGKIIGDAQNPCLFFETEAIFYGIIPLKHENRILIGPFKIRCRIQKNNHFVQNMIFSPISQY